MTIEWLGYHHIWKKICLQPLISHYLVTPSSPVTPHDDPGQQLAVVLREDFSLTVLTLTELAYACEKFGSGVGVQGDSTNVIHGVCILGRCWWLLFI